MTGRAPPTGVHFAWQMFICVLLCIAAVVAVVAAILLAPL